MPGQGTRARRLAPPRMQPIAAAKPKPPASEQDAPPSAVVGAGDLFEHFGVGVVAPRGQPQAVVEGQPCSNCGWLLRADEPTSCAMCGR